MTWRAGAADDARLWWLFGAHPRPVAQGGGVDFAVWAPHAKAVRVIGPFNDWTGTGGELHQPDPGGTWRGTIRDARVGDLYRLDVLTRAGTWVQKADPFARESELPPSTSSVIVDDSRFPWTDDAWRAAQSARSEPDRPISIYEMHLGSWRPGLGYREIADELIPYVLAHGFTHVEFLPLTEHPFGPSWGYQATGYYSPTRRYGRPADLRYLIDRLHAAGIGAILDWVPGHFPRDAFALAYFDGAPLFEDPDPRRAAQPEWGTLVFDFGSPWVRDFLVSSALYWIEEFRFDGIRVDAVASMLFLDFARTREQWRPNHLGDNRNLDGIAFLTELTSTIHSHHPESLVIAEDSSTYWGVTRPIRGGGLGFDLKWNMGWMNDSLRALSAAAVDADASWGLSRVLISPSAEHDVLALSHDEMTHGKGSLLQRAGGDTEEGHRLLRAYLAYTWAHPGKKLLFMGQEFGQRREWSEGRSLDWVTADDELHGATARFVAELNSAYRRTPALWTDGPARSLGRSDGPSGLIHFARSNGGDHFEAVVNLGADAATCTVGLEGSAMSILLRSDETVAPVAHSENDEQFPPGSELSIPPRTTIWLVNAA